MLLRLLGGSVLGLMVAGPLLLGQSQGADGVRRQPPAAPRMSTRPATDSVARDRWIGRAVLGAASFAVVKAAAVPAAVGTVGWRMLNGQPLDQAVTSSLADAKRFANRAAPTVARLDSTLSPVVGRTVRHGVRDAAKLFPGAVAPGTRGLQPTSPP